MKKIEKINEKNIEKFDKKKNNFFFKVFNIFNQNSLNPK